MPVLLSVTVPVAAVALPGRSANAIFAGTAAQRRLGGGVGVTEASADVEGTGATWTTSSFSGWVGTSPEKITNTSRTAATVATMAPSR
ncbi:hypothetical protein ACFSTC_48650 [Nonomuraea ferruginea]